ncbi:hypothetical protein QQ045_023399 [Rhodiola kirilowii]
MPALNQKNPQPWTLFFHAKYKSFRLKFRIPHNLLPASSHGQFSFILKFHHCRLKLKSVTTTNRHFLKSKLFGILRKMTPPKPKYPKNLIIPKVPRVQNKQCKSQGILSEILGRMELIEEPMLQFL